MAFDPTLDFSRERFEGARDLVETRYGTQEAIDAENRLFEDLNKVFPEIYGEDRPFGKWQQRATGGEAIEMAFRLFYAIGLDRRIVPSDLLQFIPVMGPTIVQALAVKHGLKACKIGISLNTAYTPANLKRTAEGLTGRKFKARDFDSMIEAVQDILPPQSFVGQRDSDTAHGSSWR